MGEALCLDRSRRLGDALVVYTAWVLHELTLCGVAHSSHSSLLSAHANDNTTVISFMTSPFTTPRLGLKQDQVARNRSRFRTQRAAGGPTR